MNGIKQGTGRLLARLAAILLRAVRGVVGLIKELNYAQRRSTELFLARDGYLIGPASPVATYQEFHDVAERLDAGAMNQARGLGCMVFPIVFEHGSDSLEESVEKVITFLQSFTLGVRVNRTVGDRTDNNGLDGGVADVPLGVRVLIDLAFQRRLLSEVEALGEGGGKAA